MRTLAFRALSAQVCVQCRAELLRTSSHLQQIGRAASSTTGSAALNTTRLFLLSILQFEIGQTIPSQARIWSKLNELHNTSPSSLTLSLLYELIPPLSSFNQLSKTSKLKGTGRVVAFTEEAEALYARYRFISNRLTELGEEPQNKAHILKWLEGLKTLFYGPAAWRIWEDCVRHAETEGKAVSKDVTRAVLITIAKWLKLQNNVKGVFEYNAAMREAYKQAQKIFRYLDKHGLDDWIFRSLYIRIAKEAGEFKEVQRAIKRTFGFDLDSPLAMPWPSESESSLPRIDKHSLYTVLSLYARTGNISKMMAVFETAAYTLPAPIPPHKIEDRYSFFTTNHAGPPLLRPPQKLSKATFPSISSLPSVSPVSEEVPSSLPIPYSEFPNSDSRPSISFETWSINTSTFELLIETANQLGLHAIGFHYLKELFAVWQQERMRLRSAYSELACYTVPTETRPDSPPSSPLHLSKIFQLGLPHPSVGPSIHAVHAIFEHIKKAANPSKHIRLLTALVQESKHILHLLQEDVHFWGSIVDKKKHVRLLIERQNSSQAYIPEDRVNGSLDSTEPLRERDHNEWHTSTQRLRTTEHLLLTKRTALELDDVLYRMESLQKEISTRRFVQALLYELSGRRESNAIARMRTAIHRAERWLEDEISQDRTRITAMSGVGSSLSRQRIRRIDSTQHRDTERRKKVKASLLQARIMLPNLVNDKLELRKVEANKRTAGLNGSMSVGMASDQISPKVTKSAAAEEDDVQKEHCHDVAGDTRTSPVLFKKGAVAFI